MKTVVVLSGGLDSTVLLHYHAQRHEDTRALSINYGQRHRKELKYAEMSASRLGVPWKLVDLSNLADVLPGSSQTDLSMPVPEGHYSQENMKATVVPNRNMILLAIALGHAIAYKCNAVSYAAHAGDHAIYPDCRPEFVDALNNAAALCDWSKVSIERPFIRHTKAGIVSIGANLMVPFGLTYSCYRGGELHCGVCGTCVERREAFHIAMVVDPTPYEPNAPSVEEMVAKGWGKVE